MDNSADTVRTPYGPDCPHWCQIRRRAHDTHARHVGDAGPIWVAIGQGPTWHGPRVLTTLHGDNGASVCVAMHDAPELAALLRALGHPEVAALVTEATAIVEGNHQP